MLDGIGVVKKSDGSIFFGKWKNDLKDSTGISKSQNGKHFYEECSTNYIYHIILLLRLRDKNDLAA